MPCADEVHRLQSGKEADSRLFQSFCEEGHYGGRTKPTNTRQGIYAVTARGEFLASCNTRRAETVLAMMRRALARQDELAAKKAKAQAGGRARDAKGEDQANAESGQHVSGERLERVRRWVSRLPKEALVLDVVSRDLAGARAKSRWHKQAYNFDQAWFKKAEARAFVPSELSAGAKVRVPASLVQRIVRCHLVDNVRGQTSAYRAKEVRAAELEARVTAVKGKLVSIAFEGKSEAEAKGRWPRSMRTRLAGRAVFDAKTGRFASFVLIAVGDRSGRTRYNARGGTKGREPIGFLLRLAPKERKPVAPAAIWQYGWR